MLRFEPLSPVRTIVALCLVYGLFWSHTHEVAASKQSAGGAITGQVVDPNSRLGIGRARVELRRAGARELVASTRSDPRGRFVFANLPAAEDYYLDVSATGYSPYPNGWGQREGPLPRERMSVLALGSGQWMSDLELRLWPLGMIAGRVIDEHGWPVVGISVEALAIASIAGQSRPVRGPIAKTDDRGLYELAGLPPGRYVVSIPSVQATMRATAPEPPTVMTFGYVPGGRVGGLTAGGASGTAGIAVDERHRLVLTQFATPPPPGSTLSRAYPPMFYPGARSIALATPVEVAPGTRRIGIDFSLTPVPAFRVSGRVVSSGGPPQPLLLRLMPRGSESLGFGAEAATTPLDGDGTFTFLSVPSGDYVLVAQPFVMDFAIGDSRTRLPDAVGFQGNGFAAGTKSGLPGLKFLSRRRTPVSVWGRLEVAVDGTALSDVLLHLRPTVTIRGRLEIDDPPQGSSLGGAVVVEPADGNPSMGNPRAALEAKGTDFVLEGLLPAVYRLDLSEITPGILPTAVLWNGQDLKSVGFDATSGQDFADVRITVTAKSATISGTVADAYGVGRAAVIIFPEDRSEWDNYGWTPVRFRSVMTAATGQYAISGLPEGRFRIIAVDGTFVDAWTSKPFLSAAYIAGTAVTLKLGDAATVNLRMQSVRVVQ